MRIQFLGTAAAEGIPSPFCDCPTCSNARDLKGANIRRRSSILVNQDLLIDIGPDLVWSCAALDISLQKLKYVLVTHSHFDHFYPNNLEIRSKRYQVTDSELSLTVVAGPSVQHLLGQIGYKDADMQITRNPILPNTTIELPPYRVMSIPAKHAADIGDAMLYVVDDGTSRLLYAVDTGIVDEQVLNNIRGLAFDVIIIDATNGPNPTSATHLNFENLFIMLDKLSKVKARTSRSLVYATHFSHKRNPSHEELTKLLNNLGIHCAFDGLVLDLAPGNRASEM